MLFKYEDSHMKLINTKAVTKHFLLRLMGFGLCLLLAASPMSWAQDATDALSAEAFTNEVVGPFDGLDLKARQIWINDMVYILDRGVKVKGTPTKLGLIADLKMGEEVKVTLKPNKETPSIPYVVLIERQ
jgi:hypothetical protein